MAVTDLGYVENSSTPYLYTSSYPHENSLNISTTAIPLTCPPTGWSTYNLSMYYSEISILSVIFVLAMFGNLCVLFAVWRRRAKSTRMHLFIVHLAIADIIVAVFQVFPEIMLRLLCGFYGPDASCRLMKYLQVVGMYGSTYVLVCTAMDRYLAIKYPMQTFKLSKKRVHLAIGMAWLLALLLSIPQLFFFGVRSPVPGRYGCLMMGISKEGRRIYVTWYFFSILLLPGTMLACFYGMIAAIIMKNIRMKRKAASVSRSSGNDGATVINSEFTPRASNVKIVSRAKIKTVKMTVVIVILFAICWTPFFMVQLLGVWELINRADFASSILHLLASLNSCVNPWVYMGFSGHLLAELKQAICCGRNTCDSQPIRSFRSTMTTNNTAYTSVVYAETTQTTPRQD